MDRLIGQIVQSSQQLACLFLDDAKHVTACACAAAVVPCFPFPHHLHESWLTPEGVALKTIAAANSMTIANMHASSDAAAAVLFPSSWRQKAAAACRARLVPLDDLVTQFCKETGCSAAFARLQLAAAHKTHVPGLKGAYVTRKNYKCYILRGDLEVEEPSEPSFLCMQDELSLEEQLQYLTTTNDVTELFQHISRGQPLALDQHQCAVGPPVCLSFCHICSTNWCIDCNGCTTTVLKCLVPSCTRCVHQSCHGQKTYLCSQHAHSEDSEDSKDNQQAQRQDQPKLWPVLMATGLIAHQGAWCVSLAKWPSQSPCIGLLNPNSLQHVINETGRRFDLGLWQMNFQEHSSKKMECAMSVLSQLGHAMTTATHPVQQPWPQLLAQQTRVTTTTSVFSPGVAATLYHLHLYEHFQIMYARFMHCGATEDTIDGIVMKWLTQRMPMLTGALADVQQCCSADHMHREAISALCSPRVIERSTTGSCQPMHWVATQIDAVLPTSLEEDANAMKALGLHPVAWTYQIQPSFATADLTQHCAQTPACVYPLRVMLNPSLHIAALQRVLTSLENVDDAYETFMHNEIQPIVRVTTDIVLQFRSLCIQSALYGRVYIAMLSKDISEPDTTNLLPAWHVQSVCWRSNWKPVKALCECTNATYVGFGCGNAAYWKHILPGRRAFLFEIDAEALLQLGKHNLPDSVHIVPVLNTNLKLTDLRAKAIVMTRNSWPCPDIHGCVVHDLQPGDANSKFMQLFKHAMWTHTANEQEHARAAHALSMIKQTSFYYNSSSFSSLISNKRSGLYKSSIVGSFLITNIFVRPFVANKSVIMSIVSFLVLLFCLPANSNFSASFCATSNLFTSGISCKL